MRLAKIHEKKCLTYVTTMYLHTMSIVDCDFKVQHVERRKARRSWLLPYRRVNLNQSRGLGGRRYLTHRADSHHVVAFGGQARWSRAALAEVRAVVAAGTCLLPRRLLLLPLLVPCDLLLGGQSYEMHLHDAS